MHVIVNACLRGNGPIRVEQFKHSWSPLCQSAFEQLKEKLS